MLKNDEKRKHILVFIATNYEETVFDAIYTQLQTYQLVLSIGGLTAEAVSGCYGSIKAPNHSLSSLLKMVSLLNSLPMDGTILTGGMQCINQLFSDPRLHDFLDWCVTMDKPVAVCQPMPYELIVSSKSFQTEHILLQYGESNDQFVERFMQKVA